MADTDYKVYGNLQVTKDDIAVRRIEAINYKNEILRNGNVWLAEQERKRNAGY
jgi:hypothetical protein